MSKFYSARQHCCLQDRKLPGVESRVNQSSFNCFIEQLKVCSSDYFFFILSFSIISSRPSFNQIFKTIRSKVKIEAFHSAALLNIDVLHNYNFAPSCSILSWKPQLLIF